MTTTAWTEFNDTPCCWPPISSPRQLISSFSSFSYKTSLIQDGKLNESAILENIANHKLLLSRNPSSKDLEDLCLNIFENYAAIEHEIAKHDPGFAVVGNVGYAPFHSQLCLCICYNKEAWMFKSVR